MLHSSLRSSLLFEVNFFFYFEFKTENLVNNGVSVNIPFQFTFFQVSAIVKVILSLMLAVKLPLVIIFHARHLYETNEKLL